MIKDREKLKLATKLVGRNSTPANLRKGIGLLKELSKSGFGAADVELAIEKYRGNYSKMSWTEAFNISRKYAQDGDARCMQNVGYSFLMRKGTKRNYKKAIFWLSKASTHKIPEAYSCLSYIFENGLGTKKNPQKSFEAIKKAVEYGGSDFELNLAWYYFNAYGTKLNNKKALVIFKRHAKKGDAVALNNLGLAYLNGRGVRPSSSRAIKYFTEAAEKRFEPSYLNLGNAYLEKFKKDPQPKFEKLAKQFLKKAQGTGAILSK